MSARAHARLAELHAQLAEVYRELAGETATPPTAAPARPRRRVPPSPPVPDVEVSDIDRARARRALQQIGYKVRG